MSAEEVRDSGSGEVNGGCEKELEICRCRFRDLEQQYREAKERCLALNLEVEKKKSELELLHIKCNALEAEKAALAKQIGISKGAGDELANQTSCSKDHMAREGKGEGEMVVDVEECEGEEKVFQLMVENRILECEKKYAEDKVHAWREMYRDMAARVSQLEECLRPQGVKHSLDGHIKVDSCQEKRAKSMSMDHVNAKEKVMGPAQANRDSSAVESGSSQLRKEIEGLQLTETPPTDTTWLHSASLNAERECIQLETHLEHSNRVKKQLIFDEEETPNRKMAPCTPAGARNTSFGIIDISDSDNEQDVAKPTYDVCRSKGPKGMVSENSLKSSPFYQKVKEKSHCDESCSISTPKRRRVSNIVLSDSDTDDNDDSLPLTALLKKHIREKFHVTNDYSNACLPTDSASGADDEEGFVTLPRRRLVRLRHSEEKDKRARNSCNNLGADEETMYQEILTESVDEDVEEARSDSEGESLGGFIVESSDDSVDDDNCSHSAISAGNIDFENILSTIRRSRKHETVWEFEADMLAAFGKDPFLCMEAVCALYRQQTSEEQISKGALYINGRGFSKFDAERGTTLAEFLTDGDPQGNVKKSVEELVEYDPEGLELCKTLAARYSKQLFEIYKNKEDPLFHPSYCNSGQTLDNDVHCLD